MASAGSSGSRNLTEATNPPSPGTALNALIPANFDGTNDRLGIATVDNYYSAAAWSMVVLFNADTAAAYGGDEFSNPSLLASQGSGLAAIGMSFSANGVSVWHGVGGSWPGVTVACATGGWHLAQAKYDGTNIKLRIDSGGYSSAAAANCNQLGFGESLSVGTGWDPGTLFLDGKMAEIMLAQSAISDANMDSIKSYINTRYALAL